MRWIGTTILLLTLAINIPATLAQDEWDEWDEWGDDDTWDEEADAFPLYGFVELGLGGRLSESPYHDRLSLGEARLRLETDGNWKRFGYTARADLLHDEVTNDQEARLRELSASFTVFDKIDVKTGRQVVTWGTGDYLFLNDLFPKDWQSFFIGREDEYLKAPSDALRLSGYFDWANIELVWTPNFTPDEYPRGERLSLFNPASGTFIGEAEAFKALEPDDDELAVRIYRNIESAEIAFYGYNGYHKSPEAMNADGQPAFSGLRALGASLRTPWGSGLFNAEFSRHKSKDNPSGRDPSIPNSQWRALLGYEKEWAPRLTGSLQLYVEHTEHYRQLLAAAPNPEWTPEQNRTLVTTRLTWRDRRDDLSLSLFAFYSPSERDFYLRPRLDYRFDDHLSLATGFNLFGGGASHSFFGQFEDNQNAYARVRYSF